MSADPVKDAARLGDPAKAGSATDATTPAVDSRPKLRFSAKGYDVQDLSEPGSEAEPSAPGVPFPVAEVASEHEPVVGVWLDALDRLAVAAVADMQVG